MGERAIRVWLLSDGRPGHFRQSQGVLRALRLRHAVDEDWVGVQLRGSWARLVARIWVGRCLRPMPRWLERLCYRPIMRPQGKPDLIVSAGGNTHAINVSLARETHCQNVVLGSLRGISVENFTVSLTLRRGEGGAAADGRVALDLAPTPFGPSDANLAAEAFRRANADAAGPCVTVLVGGNGAGYRYVEADWIALAEGLNATAQAVGARLIVLTSRRTGKEGERLLRQQLETERLLCFQGVSGGTEQLSVAAALGLGRHVICSEDSMSMLNECLSVGRAVLSLRPRRAEPEPEFAAFLETQAAANRLIRVTMGELKAGGWLPAWKELQPLTEDPAMALLAALRERLSILTDET